MFFNNRLLFAGAMFFAVFGAIIIIQQMFAVGYEAGYFDAYYGLDKPYIKAKIEKEGNVLKYPFKEEKTDGEENAAN